MALKRLAVLVMSCDKYSDTWSTFFAYFWKAWPDCPFPVYLGSTVMRYADHRVTSVRSISDSSWSESALSYLEQIDSEYVLLIQDDFFIEGQVLTDDVISCLDAVDQLSAEYCRLVPDRSRLKKITKSGFARFGWISVSNPYRISNQVSIWRKMTLSHHIRDGESPWEFEILGSDRTRTTKYGYLSAKWSVFLYEGHGALVRGRWTKKGLAMAKTVDANLKGVNREILSLSDTFIMHVKQVMFSIVMQMCPFVIRIYNMKRVARRT